jgi:hypothetical protein
MCSRQAKENDQNLKIEIGADVLIDIE